MARLRAGRARPLRNMVMWDVGRPAPRPPGRFAAMRSLTDCRCRGRHPRRPAEVSGGGRCAGGVKTPPYDAKDKRAVMARLRAGHARPLRNMVMWDVGRPAPRPPGRFAAMRSLTDCRCRGRHPRRPAEVSGGGRCAGGVKTPPYDAKDKRAVMARLRAGHARPLRGATNGLCTRGAREGGSPPLQVDG